MTTAQGATALASLLSIALLVWGVYGPYRAHRVDCLRCRLFELRAELFDIAASGEIPFDHPAYGMLRKILNGFLRYAHRLSWTEILVTQISLRRPSVQQIAGASFLAEWDVATRSLHPALKHRMDSTLMKMHHAAIGHVVLTSPLLAATLLPIVGIFGIRHFGRRAVRKILIHPYRLVHPRLRSWVVDPLDTKAYLLG